MPEGADLFDARGRRRLQELFHRDVRAARRGHFQKGVGHGIGSARVFQERRNRRGEPAQAQRQQPAAEKVVTGGGEAFAAAAEALRGGGKVAVGDERERGSNVGVAGLLEGRQLHAWSKIASAEVWGQVRFPPGRLFEDMAVIPQLVAATRSWRHVRQPWIGYRQRGDSIMATMTPKKTRDVLASLRELHAGLIALPGGLSAQAARAVDYFCLRTFASLARKVPREDAALAQDCRDALHAVFLAGVDAELAGYRRRGWWLRALRIRRSLARRGWLQ